MIFQMVLSFALVCALLGVAAAQVSDTAVILVLYGGHPDAKTSPDSCTLSTHEHFADTLKLARGSVPTEASNALIGNYLLEWNGQTERIEKFSWGCNTNNKECDFSVQEQEFNECFKEPANGTKPTNTFENSNGASSFGPRGASAATYASFTFYKEAEVNCIGKIGPKYDETAYPFAVASYTGPGLCEGTSSPLRSRLQLYNSVGQGCQPLPGPMIPDAGNDFVNKGFDITVIPHIILPTVTYTGGLDCTRSEDGNKCTQCAVAVDAVDDGVCEELAGTPPDFTIQSIKIGNPNDMTKCPRDPSAQGPWQEYGWQITAVFIWLLVVVGGAFAVRGVTKYRRRKEYLTLNDDLRSEQAQRDEGEVYQSILARSGNGRVGNEQRRAAIARQEESLSGGVHSANAAKTNILRTEAAVAKGRD
eukprot:gene18806-5426_t